MGHHAIAITPGVIHAGKEVQKINSKHNKTRAIMINQEVGKYTNCIHN